MSAGLKKEQHYLLLHFDVPLCLALDTQAVAWQCCRPGEGNFFGLDVENKCNVSLSRCWYVNKQVGVGGDMSTLLEQLLWKQAKEVSL